MRRPLHPTALGPPPRARSTQASRAVSSFTVIVLLAAGSALGAAARAGAGPGEDVSAAGLLADSELYYAVSGGIAGRVREARLTAKTGQVTAEYRPGDRSAGALPLSGSLEPMRYVDLWREAEQVGIWTLTVPEKARGADLLQHELRVRASKRSHAVTWTEGAATSPAASAAALIGDRVLALAREVTTER